MRELKGPLNYMITCVLVACACFHLYTAIAGVFVTVVQRSVHLAFMLPLCFLYYPATAKSPKDRPSYYDWFFILLSLAAEVFVVVDHERIYTRMEHFDPLLNSELILGTVAILLVVEATRRCVSRALAVIVFSSILYMLFGHLEIFGPFRHPSIEYQRVVEQLFLLGSEGIHGSVTGVSATYVFLFVMFGAFLIYTSVGNYIIELASAMFGRSEGGPAKVAVVSSALFGSISGSGPANVYATGSFTIPLMKRMGYSPSFAGGVEAASSTGGQYMPPVMGAAAFIIAETTGTPYFEVCKQAAVSAILYYFAIFCMVHLEAKKRGLKGLDRAEIKSGSYLLRNCFLIVPIVVILVMIMNHYTPFLAGFVGICTTFLLSFANPDRSKHLSPRRLIGALAEGSRSAVMIAVACASVGIVSAAVINTGIGLALTSMVSDIAKQSIYLAPIVTMIICMMMGMGVPCVPAYVVTAVIALPILNKLGFSGLGPHLFILYYAVIASVTPPVAVSAYAGASIAGANPLKTSIDASRVAFVGFIVPFMFLFNPGLLLQGELSSIITTVAMTTVLVFVGAIVLTGYFGKTLNWAVRSGLSVGCLALMYFIVV